MDDMNDLIIEHLGEDSYDTLLAYEVLPHQNYLEYKGNELIAMISVFEIESVNMIIAIAKDNKFTKRQWNLLYKLIREREKTTLLTADVTNDVIKRKAISNGGYWIGNTAIFE